MILPGAFLDKICISEPRTRGDDPELDYSKYPVIE